MIEVGDIIQFYHEAFVKGHKMAHPWAKIEDIVPKEDNYIRTDFSYIFSPNSEVRILKKRLPSGNYVNFAKGKTMHLKRYHFKHLSDEERKEFIRKKEEERKNRVKRKYIHDENVPFPAIDKVSRARKKSKDELSEIELFFETEEDNFNALKLSAYDALVVGIVFNRALSSKFLSEIPSTNKRDLIRCLVIEKYFNCNVKTSIALDTGGFGEDIPGHIAMNVSNNRSMKGFSEAHMNCYKYIFIDYYRCNDGYLARKMLTETFFSKSIPLLWKTLKADGKIFIPFFTSIVSNMIHYIDQIKEKFRVRYVRKHDVEKSDHFLWNASNKLLDNDTFNEVMSYEKTKDVNFGGVTLKKLMDCRSHKTTQRSVKSFCSGINSIESVYFLELTKYDNNQTFGVRKKVRKKTIKKVEKARRHKKKTSALCSTNSEVAEIQSQDRDVVEMNINSEDENVSRPSGKVTHDLSKNRVKKGKWALNKKYMRELNRIMCQHGYNIRNNSERQYETIRAKSLLTMQLYQMRRTYNYIKKSQSSSERIPYKRTSWIEYMSKMRDKLFRKRFRMTKHCFQLLCLKIIKGIGEEEFKSEQYLASQVAQNTKLGKMLMAHQKTSGGFICGEVKLAITLRILLLLMYGRNYFVPINV